MVDSSYRVGQRIKNTRLLKKITLKDLGQAVRLSEGTVQRYEAGKIKVIGIDKIKQFADALKVSPSYLAGWNEGEKWSARRKG